MAGKPRDIMSYFTMAKQERRRDKHLVVPPPKNGNTMEDLWKELNDKDLMKYSEITINPKPEYIECLEDEEVKEKIEHSLRQKLQTVKKYFSMKKDIPIDDIKWNPDILLIGEHGKEGWCKLHYHGVIGGIPNDMMAHYIKLIRSKIGRTELKYIRYEDSYKKYMFKSYREEYPETWGYQSYIKINNIK